MPREITVDHGIAVTDETVHSKWDNSLEPVVRVEPGDVVRFECHDATGGQLSPDATVADIAGLDVDRVHTITGPVAVEGAEPGDVLEVEILELEHEGWGYTLVLPGGAELGLLADEFDDPGIHVWELRDGAAHFVDDIAVPMHPFPGIVGVAPAESGTFDTLPPRSVGGNLDVKHLTAGSRVSLPVAVEEALFSVGDCHAAQGDGEVCGTAIEAPMTVTCRFELHRGRSIEQPRFRTDGPFTPTGRDEPMYVTTGVDADPTEAARIAIRRMIGHLQEVRGLSRMEAYILCSAAVDLKVNEIVSPNRVVSAYLPESIFPDGA